MECRGTFVTLEGTDGVGKTTQAALLAQAVAATGREVVRLREPGGTAIGARVREVLLGREGEGMCPECELLLFEAARAQLVREVVEPALARGAFVLSDRFADSTLAYQAAGRGIPEDVVRRANALGTCGVTPDRTLVLDLDPKLAFARATAGGADRMEAAGLAFQRRVRQGYLDLAAGEPGRVRVVDASGTQEQVAQRVASALADVLA